MTPLRRLAATAASLLAAPLLALPAAGPAGAASSDACEGGGFSLVDAAGAVVARAPEDDRLRTTIPASRLGERFTVDGRHVEFDVTAADFAVHDYAFTGAANPEDMTGGVRTPVFAGKVPDHRGLVLDGGVEVRLEDDVLRLVREGDGLEMKIQAKDCAQGGIFQMEPEREDGTATRIVHTLDPASFYFDNPHFRARVGQYLGSGCTSVETGPPSQFCVQVGTRTNIGNDVSPDFVARDSAQVAERVGQPECGAPAAPGVEHCGGTSVWDVAPGGRMGFVSGEDAVEVANPPTDCDEDCQAQNQVRGRLAVLGHPFPVPADSRFAPRTAPVPAS